MYDMSNISYIYKQHGKLSYGSSFRNHGNTSVVRSSYLFNFTVEISLRLYL